MLLFPNSDTILVIYDLYYLLNVDLLLTLSCFNVQDCVPLRVLKLNSTQFGNEPCYYMLYSKSLALYF